MENRFRVGVITSPHGVHGEVKVFPTTDDVRRFDHLREVLLKDEKTERVLQVEHVKYFKNMVILKFKEFQTMDEANTLRAKELYVTRENAIPLAENEYYIADLIGLQVRTDAGTVLGTLQDVLQTAANDVYQVQMKDGKEVLIPAIPQCILDIQPEEGYILVHLMKGLLD